MAGPFEGFENVVRSGVPLADATSFHIGGPAEYFIEPRSLDELTSLLNRCLDEGVPFRMLGRGSNILASDRGVSGAVFRLSRMRAISKSGARITCEAGASLPSLVSRAKHWGLSGLEALAGVPGTVGGAIATNAGGNHGSVASVLRSVTTLDRSGRVCERTADRLKLGYRRSELHNEVVLRAVFDLAEKDPAEVTERQAAIFLKKARTQPLGAWSAGCIFKNPETCGAGELIDRAGLKGERIGRAVVSNKHANFIINGGGAAAADVRALIALVRKRVRKEFQTDLELEIELWN